MTRTRLGLAAACVGLVGTVSVASAQTAPAAAPTFTKDVAPILNKN